jgi:hypothetical protein
MAVGGIRGGGKGGRAGGAKGAGSAGGARPAEGAGSGSKVDSSESLVGPSEMAGTGNILDHDGDDSALSSQMKAIAERYQEGQIGREEAVRLLVAEVLKKKLRVQSKVLTERITQALLGDQQQGSRLERLLSKG